jgi:hypothetical protein
MGVGAEGALVERVERRAPKGGMEVETVYKKFRL